MTVLNIDNTKTTQQNLLALVNAVNGSSLAITDVAFGTPQSVDNPAINITPATTVQITGQAPNYKDSVPFKYDRVDIKQALAALPADPIKITLDAQVDTATTALATVSNTLGIIAGNLKTAVPYGFLGGLYAGTHLGVHADPASLLYCSTADLEVHWTNLPVPSGLSWLTPSTGDDHSSLYSLVQVGNVLWHASGSILLGHSTTDGSTVLNMNLNAAMAITSANYDVGSVDANGLLWLEKQGGYDATAPSLVRINTATMAIHDQLFLGTGATYSQTRYDPINNVVWAMKTAYPSFVNQLVLLNPTTGAEQAVLPTTIGQYTAGAVLDTRRGHYWFNDYQSGNYRIRVIDHTGAVLATVSSLSQSAGGYNFYDPYAFYVTGADEIVVSDYNSHTGYYRYSRFNASTMTLTQAVDLTDDRLNDNIQSQVNIGPPRYDPVADTIVSQMEWQDDVNYLWNDQFWAVDRATMSHWSTRLGQIPAAQPTDYAIGSDGALYVLYDNYTWANDQWVAKAPPAAAPEYFLWKKPASVGVHQDALSIAPAFSVIWNCVGTMLYGFNQADGSAAALINLAGTFTMLTSNDSYEIGTVDDKGVLWLHAISVAESTAPQIIRIDTINKVVKDGLFAAASPTYRMLAMPYTQGGQLLALQTAGGTTTLVILDMTTGAVNPAGDTGPATYPTFPAGTVNGAVLDISTGWAYISQTVSGSPVLTAVCMNNANNPSVVIPGNYQFSSETGAAVIGWGDLMILDKNPTSGLYRLTKISTYNNTVTTTLDLTDVRLSPTTQKSVTVGQLRYNYVTDQMVFSAQWEDQSSVMHSEIWSVDRITMSVWQTAVPQVNQDVTTDFTIDQMSGTIYGLFNETSPADTVMAKAPNVWANRFSWCVPAYDPTLAASYGSNQDPYFTAVGTPSTANDFISGIVAANGKLWFSDNTNLYGYNTTTGNRDVMTSLQGDGGSGAFLDNAGKFWMQHAIYNGFACDFVWVDTTTGVIAGGWNVNWGALASNFGEGTVSTTPMYNPTTNEIVLWVTVQTGPTYGWAVVVVDPATGNVIRAPYTNFGAEASDVQFNNYLLDTTNNRVWAWHQYTTVGTSNPIQVIDASPAAAGILATITDAHAIQAQCGCFVAAHGEVFFIDTDPAATNKYRLRRFNASTMALILAVDIPDPRLDKNNGTASILAPVGYLPWSDEFVFTVGYDLTDTDVDTIYEMWAYSRTSLTYTRTPSVGLGVTLLNMFTFDANQNLYTFYTSDWTDSPGINLLAMAHD